MNQDGFERLTRAETKIEDLERRALAWDDSVRYGWITKGAMAVIAAVLGFFGAKITTGQ